MKIHKPKKCIRCKKLFTPRYLSSQKYCGKQGEKGTCADIVSNQQIKKWAANPKNRLAQKKMSKDWYEANKHERIPFHKNHIEINGHLKRNYGISLEEYYKLIAEQKGLCAVCHRPLDLSKRRPPVDHCHRTNKVRGVLHPACNHGIGHFNDDPQICRLAAEYLEKHK